MSSFHDTEILRELTGPLRDGLVRRTDDLQRGIALIAPRFPFGFNRINWDEVPGYFLLPCPPRTEEERRHPDLYYQKRAPEFREFIAEMGQRHRLHPNAPIVFLGDNLSFLLHMTLAVLMDHCAALFSVPQHIYIFPEPADWCLNYTFENDLFFGLSPWPEGVVPKGKRRGSRRPAP